MSYLTEGLNYQDMKNHVVPVLSIDEFKSRIGEDKDIIVLTFIVSSEAVGNDLVDWLERGYDWIIDAEVSPGEVLDKKYYVFAEMNRRSSASKRIVELLEDLYTLTDVKVDAWRLKIEDKKYPATVETIKRFVKLTSADYANSSEGDLNEWRQMAGIPTVKTYESDADIQEWQRRAGII
jgi:hypothetical protein